eukprot:gene2008-2284_t
MVDAQDKIIDAVGGKFGYKNVKKHQRDGLKAIIEGKDVFVAQPTGYGKSAIFHMPPYVQAALLCSSFDGLAASRASAIIPYFSLVICPLNSLIADQSRRLRELGCSVLSLVDEKDGRTKIRQGKYHFLFTSPESILGKYRDELRHLDFQRRVACIAVDECHCVVKWRSESKKTKHFRHLYNDIVQLRSLWLLENPIPIVALTATATQQTIRQIVKNLELKPPIRIIESPHRSNIRYTVINVMTDKPRVVFSSLIGELKSKGRHMRRVLVFCQRLIHVRSLYRCIDSQMGTFNQKEVNDLQLYEKSQGNTDEEKKELITTSLATQNGVVRLLIATVAFGMGVDCKDLDLIIHYGPPSDIDNYCQETGRAGRDGQQSHAILENEKDKDASMLTSCVKLNDEGIAVLTSKLLEYRNSLVENVGLQQIYTGFDIATGFPAETIPELISKIGVIK